MMQLSPLRAAASIASTSRPVGVRLAETSTLSCGMPAETSAARNASLSGLGLPATKVFNVDSTTDVVAATAGSTVAVGWALGRGEEEAPGWPSEGSGWLVDFVAGAAVQDAIANAAAVISNTMATRTCGAVTALQFACAVRLLIT